MSDAVLDVSTIGFTQTTAERFFQRLRGAGVRRLVDVRLHNTSQLAGFAKQPDLGFFCQAVAGIEYVHEPRLAPTEPLLKSYKNVRAADWDAYAKGFLALLEEREVERTLDRSLFDGACLLCSEATAHRCHRRLVCEYLSGRWGGRLRVRHL